jgi:AraC family transcriptional activator of pobA
MKKEMPVWKAERTSLPLKTFLYSGMESTHEPFSVSFEELDYWEARNRRNNFFELVYIISGAGNQIVENTHFPYREDSIFLLPASNCHSYEIQTKTRFLFFRFTPSFFNSDANCIVDYRKWLSSLNFLIGNYKREAGELITDQQDKATIITLLQLIMKEYNSQDRHSRRIMQSLMVAVLEIISRSMIKKIPVPLTGDKNFMELLLFIQYNLLDKELMTKQHLAVKFNISSHYFSEFFKRHAQENFQDYLIKSKLKLAETRILFSDTQFKEIAYDLGFTDSSHLNKMMKKFYTKTLTDIKKMRQS